MRANGALAASGSAAELTAFGISGFLVQLFSAPIAILVDAVSFVVSAVFLGSIRRPEPPPPAKSDREPVVREMRDGFGCVTRDRVLLAFALASMAMASLWGVFGAIGSCSPSTSSDWGRRRSASSPEFGGLSSLVGAAIAERTTRRFGIGYRPPSHR